MLPLFSDRAYDPSACQLQNSPPTRFIEIPTLHTHWVDHAPLFGRVIIFFGMALALDRHWLKPMFRIHPTQPPHVPLHYASAASVVSWGGYCPFMRHRQQGPFLHSHMLPQSRGTLELASLPLQNGADPKLVTLKATL
jgi:hypothetical protein